MVLLLVYMYDTSTHMYTDNDDDEYMWFKAR